MLTVTLDTNARTTLTEQLYTALREEIARGRMKPGDKMPSKRQLAEHLHVSTVTVESAYARLVSEGYCEGRARSGMYVAEAMPHPDAVEQRRQIPVRWDFGTGAADARHFPYTTWAKLMREVLSRQDRALLLMGDPQGDEALRRAIAGMVHRLRGIEIPPESIVLGAGTETLVTTLVSLIGRERLFAVEDPGYSRVRRILVGSGARILPVSLSGGAIDVRTLYMGGAGAAYVTPSHQFPTGMEMSGEQRRALLRWARETGGYILEDDYDSEFRFAGKIAPALRAMDAEGRVIYMNTFARTLAPGLRMSFMALPEPLAERLRGMHSACSVPAFEQETLRMFIDGGHMERHVARMRVIYRGRLQAIEHQVERLGLGTLAPCSAGLYALLTVGGSLPDRELIPRAEQVGVRVTRLDDHGVMNGGRDSARVVLLGFAGMDEQQLEEGLCALAGAWL